MEGFPESYAHVGGYAPGMTDVQWPQQPIGPDDEDFD